MLSQLAAICLLPFTVVHLPVHCASAGWWDAGRQVLKIACEKQCSAQIRSNTTGCHCNTSLDKGTSPPTWPHYGNVNLLCREADMIVLTINTEAQEIATYLVEYQQRNTNWTFPAIFPTNASDIVIPHLRENTEYKFRVWAVSQSGGIYHPMVSTWLATKRFTDAPLPVANMTLLRYEYALNDYKAVISWTPALDNSCHHDFVWYGAMDTSDYTNLEVDIPHEHTITIGRLLFNSSYMVLVRTKSTDWKQESAKVSLRLTTPTCFKVLKSLLHCVPEAPSGIQAQEELIRASSIQNSQVYDIHVSWQQPSALPDYYIVHLNTFADEETHVLNVSGMSTSAIFSNLQLGLHYEITLFAVSPAGKSNPAEFYKQIKPQHVASASGSNRLLLLFVGVFFFFVFVIPLLVYAYRKLIRRRAVTIRERPFEEYELKSSGLEETDNDTDDQFSDKYDCWEIDDKCLTLQSVLGRGAFGVVYKGCLQIGEAKSAVAVKMLLGDHTVADIQDFRQEMDIMKSVGTHPHIVSLIGCYSKGQPAELKLIVEYCDRGDLLTFLRTAWEQFTNQCSNFQQLNSNIMDANTADNKLYLLGGTDESLRIKDLISIGLQVATGMEYLSSLHVLHRDLAARNVLVCENGSVKVSDFGLSRDVYRENVYCKTSSGKLPIRWLALESLTHQVYTTQTDVWSYGVLLWEVITLGGNPYPGVQTHELLDLLIRGYRMRCPSNCSDKLYTIMSSCWEVIPSDRPSFAEIRHALDEILESTSEYLNLNLCNSLKHMDDDVKTLSSQSMSFSSERYVKAFD